MKSINKTIQIIILSFLMINFANAQTVESYSYKMPEIFLSDGGKIFVKTLTNTGTMEADFGSQYAEKIKLYLNSDMVGFSSGVKKYNPWLTTRIFTVVDNEAEADYVISGEYKFETSESKSNKENWIKESSESVKKQLPICYYSYTASSNASVNGNIRVYKSGSEIKTLPFNENKSDSKTKTMSEPGVSSASSYISTISKNAINKYSYKFSPQLFVKKYKFEKVKTKDKEFKKELKDILKNIKALLETGEIGEAGKRYIEISEKEDSPEVNFDIAQCYELIGNYTKAKEYYLKSGDKTGINDINNMISIQTQLKSLGISVTENEF